MPTSAVYYMTLSVAGAVQHTFLVMYVNSHLSPVTSFLVTSGSLTNYRHILFHFQKEVHTIFGGQTR